MKELDTDPLLAAIEPVCDRLAQPIQIGDAGGNSPDEPYRLDVWTTCYTPATVQAKSTCLATPGYGDSSNGTLEVGLSFWACRTGSFEQTVIDRLTDSCVAAGGAISVYDRPYGRDVFCEATTA